MYYSLYDVFTRKSESAHVVCIFNYLFEIQGPLEVKSGHVHCKFGNISEMVQDGVVMQTTNRK